MKLNFTHLVERTREFNQIELTKGLFSELLKERLRKSDIEMVKADVRPFLKNPSDLDIWSTDYFLQLADMVQFE